MNTNYSPAIISAWEGIHWPAIPGPEAANTSAVLYQLEKSQWWPAETIIALQHSQISLLIKHAVQTVPYYSSLYFKQAGISTTKPVTWEQWRNLPILDRVQIEKLGQQLKSSHPPEAHGGLSENHTSGFIDTPITTLATGINRFFWYIFTLRDHYWFRRDFSGKLASISSKFTIQPGKSETNSSWGPATGHLFSTGPCVMMNADTAIDEQAPWLVRENPDYLQTNPANLQKLAQWFVTEEQSLPGLKEIRTYGEVVSPDLRELCQSAWDVPISDIYTAQEVGHIALQCPESGHYHVQSENLLVEIIDSNGRPCSENEIGRVVVTTMHNFAMPLFRYFIGDYAIAGGTCPCGRGLPVIKKILGRQRNMATLPDGSLHWPSFPDEEWTNIAPVKQLQVIQKSPESIEVRLESEKSLTTEQENKFTDYLQKNLGYPFNISYSIADHLDTKANGILEQFVSEV